MASSTSELSTASSSTDIRNLFAPEDLEILASVSDVNYTKVSELLLQSQLCDIGKLLHRKYGKALLSRSREIARTTEKTWFMITIKLHDWKARLMRESLEVRGILSANSWQTENVLSLLEMLYELDSDREYMISMELFDTDTNQTVYTYGLLMYDHSSEPKYHSPSEFNLTLNFLPDPFGELIILFCHTCMAVNCKFYQCYVCRVQRYCSVGCQKKDWKTHKKVCRALENLRSQRNLESVD